MNWLVVLFVHFVFMFFATNYTNNTSSVGRQGIPEMLSFSLSHVVYNVVRIANLGENGVNAITKLERL